MNCSNGKLCANHTSCWYKLYGENDRSNLKCFDPDVESVYVDMLYCPKKQRKEHQYAVFLIKFLNYNLQNVWICTPRQVM